MKYAALLAILLAALGSAPRQAIYAAEATSALVYSDVAAVQGGQASYDYNQAVCSAVVIRKIASTEYVLATAGHCVGKTDDGDTALDVTPRHAQFFDGDIATVDYAARSATEDLGFLVVHAKRRHSVAKLTTDVYRAEEAFVFGFPDGNPWSYAGLELMQGSLFSHAPAPWDATYLSSCNACGPGDSGAGVFDFHGRLIGIMVAGDDKDALLVPTERLERYL